MIITNDANLPAPLVRAVTFDDRKNTGDYSVTELLKPPRIRALEHEHDAEITEDVADRIWALMGTAAHEVLRRSAKGTDGLTEKRLTQKITLDHNGACYTVTGQPDHVAISDDTLWDYKITSVWAVKEGPKLEWEHQLNCYRWLLAQDGVKVDKLVIIVLLRDWSVREAERDPEYPQVQVKVFSVRVWDLGDILRFIKNRIEFHENAKVELPYCSPEDMWEKPTTYALMKKGNKRATKVYRNYHEAERDREEFGGLFSVEVRPAERVRCQTYCRVAQWCTVWQAWKNRTVNNT
jgi:hypothetical protein